jgi:hypothetical protein
MPASIQGQDQIGAIHAGSLVRPPDLVELLLKRQDQTPVPKDVLVVSNGEVRKPLPNLLIYKHKNSGSSATSSSSPLFD